MDAQRIQTVLVICDDDARLAFLSRALGSHYPVLSASNEESGLTIAKKAQPDAIVIDSSISDNVDNDMIANKIHENPEMRHVPILSVYSASSRVTKKLMIKDPFTGTLLRSEIEELIGSNPPEYCTTPDPSSFEIIPMREMDRATRRDRQSDPSKTKMKHFIRESINNNMVSFWKDYVSENHRARIIPER